MSHKEDLALMAHLMRRAGFGATREELERRVAKGYEATVEELLNPTDEQPPGQVALMLRYHPSFLLPGGVPFSGQANWMYQMLSTQRPLEEKMALFWHHIFATGNSKVDNADQMLVQVELFRKYGMGDYKTMLVELSKNPAMIFWLDNNENHRDAVNENWGRELLELFSMGVSNYTEVDVREVSRAFTGWTIAPKLPRLPYGRFSWKFEYKEEDHDDTEKSFLGQNGRFNGEDVIDIIVKEPATARFICRHLYNFFVADEPQVPAWTIEPARDEEALELMIDSFVSSGYDIKAVLRTIFTSEFFKKARFAKIKSPTEVVAGTLKMVGEFQFPDYGLLQIGKEPTYMGQSLLDPPSVEGWHTGNEWINSGSLLARINFVADRVANTSLPGVQTIISQMKADGVRTPEDLVDASLEHMGYLELAEETKGQLLEYARGGGNLDWKDQETSGRRVGEMLALIGATTEYQFG
ncbi:MAG TPA: DUF1800 domain-containing protein [Dehalococcoidia bacterium]|nr:DUF1800 domain-containing protein [Dehalococcoidia bacterium]